MARDRPQTVHVPSSSVAVSASTGPFVADIPARTLIPALYMFDPSTAATTTPDKHWFEAVGKIVGRSVGFAS